MNIETAKTISSMSIGILMARQGVGEFSDSDIAQLKKTSLADMLEANRLMTDYKEQLPGGGTRNFFHTTDNALAELYCRLHNDEFHLSSDLVEACDAIDGLRHSVNGHGILIDGGNNYSFIELNTAGDGSLETIAQACSINELLGEVMKLARKLEEVEI
ncbi:hypothetical protein ACM257_17530 [Alteromonas macleodii]|uniref:hypothetical protein n=1 Tax=Alteromonas macleodii TaxID=28108 RepID=UPI0039F6C962